MKMDDEVCPECAIEREMLHVALKQLHEAHREMARLQARYDELRNEMQRYVRNQVKS